MIFLGDRSAGSVFRVRIQVRSAGSVLNCVGGLVILLSSVSWVSSIGRFRLVML